MRNLHWSSSLTLVQAQTQFPDVAKGKAAVGRVYALIDREPKVRGLACHHSLSSSALVADRKRHCMPPPSWLWCSS